MQIRESSLRTHRRQIGFSQHEVAFLLGTDQGNQARYELGSRIPSLHNVLTLETIMGVSARKLFPCTVGNVERELRPRLQALIATLKSQADEPLTAHKLTTLHDRLENLTPSNVDAV